MSEAFERLSDEEAIAKKRIESEKVAAQWTMDQYNLLRKLCKTNLYFLSKTILGYDWLSPNLHGHFCSWKQRTDSSHRFRLELLPRGHLKSTIDTISDSIRCVLPDDKGYTPYPECLGPEIRLMIGHETVDGASPFLESIAGHFMSNTFLMGLFPECIPSRKNQKINSYQLELPRKHRWPEPTIDTMGVGAKAQGRHYNKLKLDDLIGDKARDSKTEMATAIRWVDGIQSFLSSFTEDEIDFIGTRWGFDDLYAHIMKVYGDELAVYTRSAIEKDVEGNDIPIFPERFTLKSFEIIKKNKTHWNANYLNNPELIDSAFLPGWLRFYNRRGPNTVVIFNRQDTGIISVEQYNIMTQTDRVILIDPATSGNCGIVVTGMTANGRIFILEAIKGVFRPNDLTNKVFQLVSRYQPRTVAIEEVLFSEVYRPWWQREMLLRGIRFHITPVKPETRSKGSRIHGLSQNYAAGEIYHDQNHTDILEEYKTLGASIVNKHLLDALAYGPKVWVKPYNLSGTQNEVALAQTNDDPMKIPSTGY